MKQLGIEWTVEKKPVADLVEWDKNPRIITEENYVELKKRLQERGFHDVLKLDHDAKTVLSGNQRLKILKEYGREECFCMIPERELTQEEKEKVALESNRFDGGWDWDKLANEFDKDLLLDVGFKDFELGFDSSGDEFEEFEEGDANEYNKNTIIYFMFPEKSDVEDVKSRLGEKSVRIDGGVLLKLLDDVKR